MVAFSLDGKAYRTETSAAYDLVGTTATGAKPFLPSTLKAGRHTITAVVTASSGAKTRVSAAFTVPAAIAKTLTSQYLRISAAPSGKPTVHLDKAIVRGTRYAIFSTVLGQVKASYTLDGKVIRAAKANVFGKIKVKTLKVAGLKKGIHLLVLRLVNKAGHVTTVKARFRIA